MINTDIVLNFKSPNINTIVHAKQNDRLSRYVLAYMKDGDSPWEPPERLLATVRYKKADGHIGFYDVDENGNPAVTFDDNIATVYIAEQALTAPGHVLMELTLYTPQPAGERLSSFYFILEVEESAMEDDDFESTDYFNILTYEITQLLARIDSIAGVTAEAHAIPYGQETYVVVTGGTGIEDPYHMKFYIESAKPINPRGNYNAQTTYNIIDLIFYNGDSYLAIKDNVKGVTPGTDSTKWQKISTAAKVSSQTYQYEAQTESAYTGTPPQTGWQQNPPEAIPGGYLWAKIVTSYTDGSSYTTYNVTRNGEDGIGAPGSATPKMDGTATVGTANAFSREDHVHPSDTTRVPTTRTVNGMELSGDIATRLVFENKASSSWTELSATAEDYNADYPWRGTLTCTGVTASMIPEIIFSIEDATSGEFAPIARTDAGEIYIYAANEPTGTVTVPTVIAWK